jgi:hypothetical protein
MIKQNTMTDFPTEFELRELQAEVGGETDLIHADLSGDDYADAMMIELGL